ncbi:toxin-antitoxin system HicB family antitoxin [Nonomuraea sp. NPDC049152]|uniref:toxin-antitoxin system HicB family antitoxin n=1 Tax=Nonomuraea sp. NPDC049152 TaxID=3154350 RepID=UPI0033CA54CE
MDLTQYIENLRREFGDAAEAAGPEARATADRLTGLLDSALRLTLIEVLSEAADELTREIEPGVVDVRIRGRQPEFVVTMPSPWHAGPPGAPQPPGAPFPPAAPVPPGAPLPPAPPEPPVPPGDNDQGTARMTLRLPEALKARIERAAATSGVSVNAWLVRALSGAVSEPQPQGPPPTIGRRISGWVS